jgi:hypothetical protein
LEFHVPFYALRRGSEKRDSRQLDGQCLRASRALPLCRFEEEIHDFYHEAHASLLVTGVDEWVWTAYFCVDTYFGAEPNWQSYPKITSSGHDGPTGGWIFQKHPFWNPREYFLVVLKRRMMQVTAEWTVLIDTYEQRLNQYVRNCPFLTSLFCNQGFLLSVNNTLHQEEKTLFKFFDDPDLRRTEKLTLIVSTLRRFRDTLSRTIDAWKNFESGDLKFFDITGSEEYQQQWYTIISDIQQQVAQLKSLHSLMAQKLELFNSMRDGVRLSRLSTFDWKYFLPQLVSQIQILMLAAACECFPIERKRCLNFARERYRAFDSHDSGEQYTLLSLINYPSGIES